MENASSALKMAFAILVFMMAVSILFSLISKIRETADSVLFYADKTNYYEWEDGSLENGRIVGEDTVVSALYGKKDSLTYIFIEKNGIQIFPQNNINLEDLIANELSERSYILRKYFRSINKWKIHVCRRRNKSYNRARRY